MKRILVLICCIGGLVLITGGIIFVKMFIIGNLMDIERVSISNIAIDNTKMEINGGFFQDSALAYKGCKYRIEGNNIYVKIYSTVVSSFYKYGNIKIVINGDLSEIQNVYLEDLNNKKAIWCRSQ